MSGMGDKPRPVKGGNSNGRLGVRAVDKQPPDVRGLARAFIGVIIARRYDDREAANTAMASYPSRHTPSPRRPRTGRQSDPSGDTPTEP